MSLSQANFEPMPATRSHYQYSRWHYVNGERRAARCSYYGHGLPPDLINTAYRNRDGSRTVFGLPFDLDVKNADSRWLDADGRLDWPKISAHLAEAHPEIFHEIAFVARSTGGKGLGLVIAINPLPIRASTAANQRALHNLQTRLIGFFAALGLGADPAARGLERDVPNFNDLTRRVYENTLALRRAEKTDEGVGTKLHAYLNALAAKDRLDARIYPDARAETGLAHLFAWLLCDHEPNGLPLPDRPGGSVEAPVKELAAMTGLCSDFLRKRLKSPPPWLAAEYLGRNEGWRLHAVLGSNTPTLLARAAYLLDRDHKLSSLPESVLQPKKLLVSIAEIKEPQFVRHGEHNQWVTALALAYKWHGYEEAEALQKIELRSLWLPERQTSITCRDIAGIVHSIYKNQPHLAGRFMASELPLWMAQDEGFKDSSLSHRGGQRKLLPVQSSPLVVSGASIEAVDGVGEDDACPGLPNNSVDHRRDEAPLGAEQGDVVTPAPEDRQPTPASPDARFPLVARAGPLFDDEGLSDLSQVSHRTLTALKKGLRVRADGHVLLDGKYYSAPPSCVGQQMKVAVTANAVRLISASGEEVVHRRIKGRYVRSSTLAEHLAPWLNAAKPWSSYRSQARAIGASADEFVLRLIEAGEGVINFAAIFGLFALAKDFGAASVDRACEQAVAMGAVRLKMVKVLLPAVTKTKGKVGEAGKLLPNEG